MSARREMTLESLLTAQHAGIAIASADPGDQALAAGRYSEAVRAYSSRIQPSKHCRAKHGYALARSGCLSKATDLLTTSNVGSHPTAKAALAWSLYYGTDNPDERRSRIGPCKTLLKDIAESEKLSEYAYSVLLNLWFYVSFGGRPTAIAERAANDFPKSGELVAILARERRISGNFEPATAPLLRGVIDQPLADVLAEAYQWGIQTGDWGLAIDALKRVTAASADAAQHLDIDLLTAYIFFHQARTGDSDAARRGWSLLEPWLLGEGNTCVRPIDAARVATCLATQTNESENIRLAANQFIDLVYDGGAGSGHLYDLLFVSVELGGYDDVLRVELALPLFDNPNVVATCLDTGYRIMWELLAACVAVTNGTDSDTDLSTIRSSGPLFGPACELSTIFGALADEEPIDAWALGTLLARFAVAAEADSEGSLRRHLGYLTPSLSDMDTPIIREIFESAFEQMDERDVGTGEAVITVWGELLQRTAPDILIQFGQRYQQQTGNEPDLPDPVASALAGFPTLDEGPTDPGDISLMHAAALIAIMRAEIDHTSWTMGPLEDLAAPFEPEASGLRRQFITVLFELAREGVIGFSKKTPTGVLSVKEGRLYAHLDKVIWSFSARTLKLHRAIRDLPRARWPDSWRQSVAILSRDVAAQELMVYFLYLCGQRQLPPPEDQEVLPLLRHLLESRSLAHGYYLVAKTVREAVDYQAKYRAGQRQIITRLHKLLRGNIDRSMENGWDTRYRRDRDIQVSLLFQALHDVLTGWGSRAFDEPVFSLALPDDPPLA